MNSILTEWSIVNSVLVDCFILNSVVIGRFKANSFSSSSSSSSSIIYLFLFILLRNYFARLFSCVFRFYRLIYCKLCYRRFITFSALINFWVVLVVNLFIECFYFLQILLIIE